MILPLHSPGTTRMSSGVEDSKNAYIAERTWLPPGSVYNQSPYCSMFYYGLTLDSGWYYQVLSIAFFPILHIFKYL